MRVLVLFPLFDRGTIFTCGKTHIYAKEHIACGITNNNQNVLDNKVEKNLLSVTACTENELPSQVKTLLLVIFTYLLRE